MSQSSFHNIIGHERVQDVLSRMIEHDRLPHAFLFAGPHHLGKTFIAKQLMNVLMGEKENLETHLDVIELACLFDEKTGKKKTQISVEQVRALCERLAMSSLHGGWKIAFIKEANALSHAAANALLKTLEEPKGKTLFILRAPSIGSVLDTVMSRCQIIRFHPIDRESLTTALVKKGYARSDAQQAASISLGRPGRALRYLTKSDDRSRIDIGVKQAVELFSSTRTKQIRLTSGLLPKEDVNKRAVADQTIRLWQAVLRDRLLQDIGCEELMVYRNASVGAGQAPPVHSKNISCLIATLKRTEEGRNAILHNTNPQLTLEHILFSL